MPALEPLTRLTQFLRWSEKYTKTDMLYLAKGGGWLSLAQVVSALASFILTIVFANFFPPDLYGTYKYILAVISLLTLTSLPGLGTALTQAAARGLDGSLTKALPIKIAWGLTGSILSLVIAYYHATSGNALLSKSFVIAALFIPLLDSFGIYDAWLKGKKLFAKAATYSVIVKISGTAVLISTILVTNNLLAVLFSYLVIYTLLRIGFYFRTINLNQLNNDLDKKTIPYGKHLSLMGVVSAMANYLDRLLIFHFLGAVELAIYSIALAAPEQVKMFFKNINVLALPKFSQASNQNLRLGMTSKMLKLGLLAALTAGVYIIVAPALFKILFPLYSESIFYSQIFMASLITIVSVLPLSALEAKIAQKELYIYNFTSAIIQIGLLVVLIPLAGLMGAIIAKISFRVVNALVIYTLFSQKMAKTLK